MENFLKQLDPPPHFYDMLFYRRKTFSETHGRERRRFRWVLSAGAYENFTVRPLPQF